MSPFVCHLDIFSNAAKAIEENFPEVRCVILFGTESFICKRCSKEHLFELWRKKDSASLYSFMKLSVRNHLNECHGGAVPSVPAVKAVIPEPPKHKRGFRLDKA